MRTTYSWHMHLNNINKTFVFTWEKQCKNNTLQASKTSLSVSKDITSTPTIGEHDLRVKTFLISGWFSPCKVTRLATYDEKSNISLLINRMTNIKWKVSKFYIKYIRWTGRTWITGSWVGSGKWPLRPAHSMSKLSMRNGAIFENSPSGAWLISSEYL